MGVIDKAKKFMGLDFNDEDFDITQEEIDLERKKLEEVSSIPEPTAPPASNSKIEPRMTGINTIPEINTKHERTYDVAPPLTSSSSINMKSHDSVRKKQSINGSGQFKMIVIEPKNFDECIKLVDNLKARKPIIVNLERVESVLANRMFNFLAGATYALDGTAQKITTNIVIFSPANVNVAAVVNREYTNAGTPAQADNKKDSPWG